MSEMISKTTKSWTPKHWASYRPLGIGLQRPNNFAEVFRAGWENRDRLGFAWKILTKGVCDGCALGTKGIHDWTTKGVHLCNIRLRLLRLNTMPAFAPESLPRWSELQGMNDRQLRALGRIPVPLAKVGGKKELMPISWQEAFDIITTKMKLYSPREMAFYLTSRGTGNETYYVAQKAARALGTNSIDNAARICHAPSTSALRSSLGIAATSCSYRDWIGTDLILFFGSNVANNQPVAIKYLHYAKKAGTKIIVINPYQEPGMEKYWIPSVPESAIFGTKITDHFFKVTTGGDRAFILGVIKALCAQGGFDRRFIDEHTNEFQSLKEQAAATEWQYLEQNSGAPREAMESCAQLLSKADKAVFVWSMGITQHQRGEDNVRAILNLALMGGFVGRDGCGVMPIRGHSGVQGGAEMGCYTHVLPGGIPLNHESADRFSAKWGFSVPTAPGLKTVEMLQEAIAGKLKALVTVGGNFVDVMPNPAASVRALGNLDLRVHMDIVISKQMLVDGPGTMVVLPATTRYEVPRGITETTTERRVILSPEIPGPRIRDAKPEWEVFCELIKRLRPDLAYAFNFNDTADIRREIGTFIPEYQQITELKEGGDSFQIGGQHLCKDWIFPTPDGRAKFHTIDVANTGAGPKLFRLSTRRGKQFNSMVMEELDAITGASRNEVLISHEDCKQLGLLQGDRVRLKNELGEWVGIVRQSQIVPGNLQVHWPECNHLLDEKIVSPEAGIPDYNALVHCEKIHA